MKKTEKTAKTPRTARLIRPDGSMADISPKGDKFTLAELQALVGGYIEHVPLKPALDMIVNEDGRRLGLPFNSNASTLANTEIVGNAILIHRVLWE